MQHTEFLVGTAISAMARSVGIGPLPSKIFKQKLPQDAGRVPWTVQVLVHLERVVRCNYVTNITIKCSLSAKPVNFEVSSDCTNLFGCRMCTL